MKTSTEFIHVKRVFDSVHGFIELTYPERVLLSVKPLYRLRFIKQCGGAFLVYPGATHTRFEHSLGVMHVASLLFEKIFNPKMALFNSLEHYIYCKYLVRFAALLHDVGHLPFSHTAENEILGYKGHEKKGKEIILSSLLDQACFSFIQEDAFVQNMDRLKQDLIAVCFHQTKDPLLNLLAELITGDFFGADRIDYLLRDGKKIALAYGSFDYTMLIRKVEVDSENHRLCLLSGGVEAMEGLLMSRYYMFQRVCNHPKVRLINMHLNQFMLSSYHWLATCDVEEYVNVFDETLWHEIITRDEPTIHTQALQQPMQLQLIALRITTQLGATTTQVKEELEELALQYKDGYNLFIEYAIREEKPLDPTRLFVKSGKSQKPIMEVSNLLKSAPNLVTSMNKWIFVDPSIKKEILSKDYETFCLEEVS